MKETRSDRWPPAAVGAMALVFLFLYAAKMRRLFSGIDLSSPYPILNVDYVQYYARALRTHLFLSQSGRIWGYDPFEMAGYVSGIFLAVGSYPLSLLAHVLLPVLPIHLTLLLLEVGVLTALPFVLFPALASLGAGKAEQWIAFGIVTIVYGQVELMSWIVWRGGLWGYQTCAFLSLLQVTLLLRWLERPRLGAWIAMVAVTAIVFQVHPSVFVLIAAPSAVAYLAWMNRLRPRDHVFVLAGVLLVVLANWYWIHPFWVFRHWRGDVPYMFTHGWPDVAQTLNPFVGSLEAALRALTLDILIGLAASGLWSLSRRKRRAAIVLTMWVEWLFIVSFFGSGLPGLATVQPSRTRLPFFLVIMMLAALSPLWRRRGPARIALLAGWFPMAAWVAWVSVGRNPWPLMTNRFPDYQQKLIDYLQTHGPFPGRLLLQCGETRQPHFADLLPALTHQPLLGGPHPGNFLATRFSTFAELYVTHGRYINGVSMAFDRALRNISPALFKKYLELYAVGGVAARAPDAVAYLDALPYLERVARLDSWAVYRVRETPSWFLEGGGDLSFDYDRLVVAHATGPRVTLKFHFIRTLTVNAPYRLTRRMEMDDPVPFIEIERPAEAGGDIVIRNAGL